MTVYIISRCSCRLGLDCPSDDSEPQKRACRACHSAKVACGALFAGSSMTLAIGADGSAPRPGVRAAGDGGTWQSRPNVRYRYRVVRAAAIEGEGTVAIAIARAPCPLRPAATLSALRCGPPPRWKLRRACGSGPVAWLSVRTHGRGARVRALCVRSHLVLDDALEEDVNERGRLQCCRCVAPLAVPPAARRRQ